MKRRNFLKGLAAVGLAPKILLPAEPPPAPVTKPAPFAGLSGSTYRTYTTLGEQTPAEVCRRFAEKYRLGLRLAGNEMTAHTARFTVVPAGPRIQELGFTANLRPWSPGYQPDMLVRQLKYQFLKSLQAAGLSEREFELVIGRSRSRK